MEATVIVISFISLFLIGGKILKRRSFIKKLNLLAKNSRLTSKDDEKNVYPKFRLKRNWLYIKNFNPLINELHFDSKLLTSFSNLYGIKFLKAVYEKNGLVLKASRAKRTSFLKHHPKSLNPYHAFLGTDENGESFIINTTQRVSFLIGGPMGSGKSILADRLHLSLIKSCNEEKSYVFCKNRNDFTATDRTVFVSKDDKAKMLWHLKEIQIEVIERQKDIERDGHRNGIEAKLRPIYLIADEVHSYVKNLNSSYSKEERQIQSEIIEILRFLLLQGRSSLIYLIFITPNLERNETDLNLRDCSFYLSSKLNSEEVAKNLFDSSVPYLMPYEIGLFAFTDKNRLRILKVAED